MEVVIIRDGRAIAHTKGMKVVDLDIAKNGMCPLCHGELLVPAVRQGGALICYNCKIDWDNISTGSIIKRAMGE